MRVIFFLSLLMVSLFSGTAQAEHEGEGWVRNRLIAEWRGRVERLSNLERWSSADFRELDDLWFGLNDRAREIRKWRFEGITYSHELLVELESRELPALRSVLLRLGREPSRAEYDRRVKEHSVRLQAAERELRALVERLPKRAVKRLLSLAAFARSGTLGAGKIGKWNPASPEAIQSSALDGLGRVLSNIENLGDRRADLDFLRAQQTLLLGLAQHHFSRAGEIMNRRIVREDGSETTLLDHLNHWVNDLGLPPRSSDDALASYARLLHLHPFGDSNGRVAEIAKQLLLSRLGLPALLTPEKTSIETYRDSIGWGQADFVGPVLEQVRETIAFLASFEDLQSRGWRLTGASLSGPVLVAELKNGGRRAFAVIPRVLSAMGDLPPAPGAIVLAGKKATSLRLWLGVDGWGSTENLEPLHLTEARRAGDLHVSYPLFFRELRAGERGDLHFDFHYLHDRGFAIWFNNDGRDYFHSSCRGALE